MTEPGWRIAVPAAWVAAGRQVAQPTAEGPVCSSGLTLTSVTGSTPAAILDTDAWLGLSPQCMIVQPGLVHTVHPPKPIDGLIVNVKPLAGWPGGTPVCRALNGLRSCVVDGLPADVDILDVWVHAPLEARPMLLEIGLAGTGATAKTVLDSLHAIRCPSNTLCTAAK